jgi:S1-C subfamily serine protease
MDIEKLTKQQIILVTLLVSFVTSIATGIVTVALMDQAPPGVTQTINRVVERTVEKVVTPPTTGNTAAVVTRETVVVKEDEKIVETVDKNKDSIVRIYTDSNRTENRIFVGLGTVVSADGLIATGDVFADTSGRYVVTPNGTDFYKVKVLDKKRDAKLYFLRVVPDETKPATFKPVTFGDSNSLKLGQTVIAIGGNVRNSVSTGIVSSLIEAEIKTNNTASTTATSTPQGRQIVGINANTANIEYLSGGPLLNLYGEMVGIRISQGITYEFGFLPANVLKSEIAGL